MLRRKLSAAFEQWQLEAAEGKSEEAALRRALMQMVMTKLAQGLRVWREVAADAKRKAKTAGGAALRRVVGKRIQLLTRQTLAPSASRVRCVAYSSQRIARASS